MYQLVVVARDRGHDPLTSEVVVVVRLEDSNDNAPVITVRTLEQLNAGDETGGGGTETGLHHGSAVALSSASAAIAQVYSVLCCCVEEF